MCVSALWVGLLQPEGWEDAERAQLCGAQAVMRLVSMLIGTTASLQFTSTI